MSTGTQSVKSVVGDEGSVAPYGFLVGLNPKWGTHPLINTEYKFGRSSETNDFCYPNNGEISGHHCTLFVENNLHGEVSRVMIKDNSTNGTFVDGERITKSVAVELKNGSEIALGVKSAQVARKSSNLKDKFVAFLFRSHLDDLDADIHPAFRETNGPNEVYECNKTLGSGAFAEVRLCLHRKTGKKYAAKIVDKKKFALNKELRAGSFRDEVEILKSIRHPYIVRVEDIFETDAYLTIVLQYVSGGDLFDTLVKLKRYNEDDAKIVFLQMAQGLRYLHQRNIAHRDLKPENFLVLSDKSTRHILMGDFGLARVFAGQQQFMKTLCGTPQYLAPEVVRQAQQSKMEGYTQAVDVWALGVILYILLSGYPPFGPRDFDDIVDARYDFNHARWKTVSEDAKSLVRRMMRKDPNERLTIEQVCDDAWLKDVVVPELVDPDLDAAPPARQPTMGGERKPVAVVAEAPDSAGKVVRFEQPENERKPTEVREDEEEKKSKERRRKIKEREPTGIKRDRVEENDEDEEDNNKMDEEEDKVEETVKKTKSGEEWTLESLKKLRVVDLKEKLTELGLETKGLKDDLIKRLLKHQEEK